jgi:hypothetical protein
MWERLNCISRGIRWWLPDVNLVQQQTTKREYCSLQYHQIFVRYKSLMNISKSDVCTGSCGSMGPTVFYTFLLESAHWSRKQYTDIWGYRSLKVPRLCGSYFFCRSQPSGPVWSLESVGEILCQKFKFVAEIWISWQKYILNLCEKKQHQNQHQYYHFVGVLEPVSCETFIFQTHRF